MRWPIINDGLASLTSFLFFHESLALQGVLLDSSARFYPKTLPPQPKERAQNAESSSELMVSGSLYPRVWILVSKKTHHPLRMCTLNVATELVAIRMHRSRMRP